MEFLITTRIPATAENIYNTWLNSAGHSKMTGGEASITNQDRGQIHGLGRLYRRKKY